MKLDGYFLVGETFFLILFFIPINVGENCREVVFLPVFPPIMKSREYSWVLFPQRWLFWNWAFFFCSSPMMEGIGFFERERVGTFFIRFFFVPFRFVFHCFFFGSKDFFATCFVLFFGRNRDCGRLELYMYGGELVFTFPRSDRWIEWEKNKHARFQWARRKRSILDKVLVEPSMEVG